MNQHLLYLGYVWPEPTSSAAGIRTWQVLEGFLARGWKVSFASTSRETRHRESLELRGIETHGICLNDSSFDSWAGALSPGLVVFDRFVTEEQFGYRVRSSCPETLRVVDTQDLHFLRRYREEEAKKTRGVVGSFPKHPGEHGLRELASILRSDLSLVISEREWELLTQVYGVDPERLFYLPFIFTELRASPPFEKRERYSMIGNFRHSPNWDSVQWLRKEIWPEIRKLQPDAEVHVYGAYVSREAMALHDPGTEFHLRGFAQDQYETLANYRVNLTPLRFGAGLKGKIVDGFLVGTPCVSTSVGAEGLGSPFAGLVADRPQDFAKQAVMLYSDRTRWEASSALGRKWIRESAQPKKYLPRLFDRLESLNSGGRRNLMG